MKLSFHSFKVEINKYILSLSLKHCFYTFDGNINDYLHVILLHLIQTVKNIF